MLNKTVFFMASRLSTALTVGNAAGANHRHREVMYVSSRTNFTFRGHAGADRIRLKPKNEFEALRKECPKTSKGRRP